MRWNLKKFASLIWIVTFVTNSSITVSAENLGQGSEIGVGEVEGSVKTDIYQVVLPTDTKGIFDFILDPQGLINKTNAAAYDGDTFEEGATVFFKRTEGQAKVDYSNTSDFVTITNKSSIAVNVSLHVSISPESIDGIALTDDKEFTDDNSASLYLAVVDGENEIPIGEEGVTIDVTIEAAPEGAYEYIYNEDSDEYIYKLSDDLGGIEFHDYSFQLTGAANGEGDWSEVMGAEPEVTVAWEITTNE